MPTGAPGATADAQWEFVREGLSRFAGRPLGLDEEMYESASARTRGTEASQSCFSSMTGSTPTRRRQSTCPLTGERVVDAATCRHTLVVMATAGLYETSGD